MYNNNNDLHEALFGNVERTLEKHRQEHQQMLRCKKCVNRSSCHGGIVGCGAFTPRVYTESR